MIARANIRKKRLLSKTTIMALRNIVRKGTDDQIEDFFRRVSDEYIAEVKGADLVDKEEYLKVKGVKFDCECPYCHEKMTLELEELLEH